MSIIHGEVVSVTIVSDQSTPLTTMLPGTSSSGRPEAVVQPADGGAEQAHEEPARAAAGGR